MWRQFLLIFLILGVVSLPATQKRLEFIYLPLYYHGSDTNETIVMMTVPYAIYSSYPEGRGAVMSKPYIPPALEANHQPGDVNLISLYDITISADLVVDRERRRSGPDMIVTIDASKAIRPAGHPFSIEQVIEAARACVEKNFPSSETHRVTVKVIDSAAKLRSQTGP